MARTNKIGTTATKVITDPDGLIRVRYHNTDVVTITPNKKSILLDTGGYYTATTKLRMNQAANQFGLGYSVFQADYDWFVNFQGETIPFTQRVLALEVK